MKITLVARYEWLDDLQSPSWGGADSLQVPGFFAAAASLGELQREAGSALRWAHEGEDLEVTWGYRDIPLGAAAAISHLVTLATTGMLSSGQQIVSPTTTLEHLRR